LRLADIPSKELTLARHVHISSYYLQPGLVPQLPGVIGSLREGGVTLSVDPNWDPTGQWDNGLASLLGSVDVFLPNAAEARAITGADGTEAAALQLARQANLVVVKDGENGCVAAHHSSITSQPGFAVHSVETTGAGDAFNAGFLRAWLEELPLPDCLAYGCAAGALSTRSVGATGALATMDELKATVYRGSHNY
jgi:sugar/nucleoside kinase (ribokinase family)